MKEIILCKLGEAVLKGANKRVFESAVTRELRRRSHAYGNFKVYMLQSTYYIEPLDPMCDMEGMYEAARRTFGIVRVSRAAECEKDMESIINTAREYIVPKMAGKKTFRVDAKRADKSFPMQSPEICAAVGGALLDAMPDKRVDLHEPHASVRIEIRDRMAYVHASQESGAGGLPYGSSGRGLLLLSGGIDSPVAGYMMAKRGMEVEALYFESPPYTSDMARDKVLKLAERLCAYCGHIYVHIISLTEAEEAIRKECDEEYFTLLLRRFMMTLAERTAKVTRSQALVTGESLGQVASQTMEAIAVTDAAVSMPVLRPCIGMDKEEIISLSRRIDTFDISSLPYEDCCTVFTPRHPRTRPKYDDVMAQLARLDFDAISSRAFEGMQTVLCKDDNN